MSFPLCAQIISNKGTPYIQNFKPSDYLHKGKIWDIKSAPNGLMYFASDKALIEFDGKNWKTFKGSNGTIRALLVANDSIIYTGSDLDFGVFRKNEKNQFYYTSLYPFQKDVQDLYEEFWDVYPLNESIAFVSSKNIYLYKNEQLTKISAPLLFSGSYMHKGVLYLTDKQSGLMQFSGLSLQQLAAFDKSYPFELAGIFESNGNLFAVSRNLGLFQITDKILVPVNNSLSELMKKSKVFSFDILDDEYLALGTVFNGLYIVEKTGKVLHLINKQKALLNNTVLSLHYDQTGRLWLGLDFGISSIDLAGSLRLIYDYNGNFGTPSKAMLVDNNLILGTNQGLYYLPWVDIDNQKNINDFKLIPGSEGQVWSIDSVNGDIFVCHDNGLFMYDNGKLLKLDSREGVLTIIPYKSYLLAGNYNGISIYKKDNNEWKFWKKMNLIVGSCTQIVVDDNEKLWINIPNFGVIQTRLSDQLEPADRVIFDQGQFEGENLYLTFTSQSILVNTSQFKYIYNPKIAKFEKKSYNTFLPKQIDILSGVYNISKLNDEYGYFPVYNGLALIYQNETDKKHISIKPMLREIVGFNNFKSIEVSGDQKLPYELNNIRIKFIVPNREDLQYQYKLKSQNQWSEWSNDTYLEIINLKPGKHIIQIRAGKEDYISESLMVSVYICPQWYRSWTAYGIYLLMFIVIAYLFYYWQKLKFKKHRKKMLRKEQESLRKQAEKHKLKIEEIEQAQLKNEFEQLKLQLKHKTVELAAKAKENEDKNRLLVTLKEKLDDAQSNPAKSKIRWGEIQSLLDAYLNVDDKTFEIQMDELHQEFFRKLKKQFPELSIQDLRLCAYLKIGLNSKEIADLMQVKPSSAYISRSRLRKKLNLNSEDDLHDFLNKI